jgi:hypothetical protein
MMTLARTVGVAAPPRRTGAGHRRVARASGPVPGRRGSGSVMSAQRGRPQPEARPGTQADDSEAKSFSGY